MENLGITKFMQELRRLNPHTSVCYVTDGFVTTIITGHIFRSSLSKIKLPEGYYWNKKNGITNKHNTASGTYESFELMTKRDYRNLMC